MAQGWSTRSQRFIADRLPSSFRKVPSVPCVEAISGNRNGTHREQVKACVVLTVNVPFLVTQNVPLTTFLFSPSMTSFV